MEKNPSTVSAAQNENVEHASYLFHVGSGGHRTAAARLLLSIKWVDIQCCGITIWTDW